MERKLINFAGLTGIISLISYTIAVIFAPLAFPGYDWASVSSFDCPESRANSSIFSRTVSFRATAVSCIEISTISLIFASSRPSV